MPAPTITANLARRKQSRVHLIKQTEISLTQYQGKRFLKLAIDDPFLPSIAIQTRTDATLPEPEPEPQPTREQLLRRARQQQLQSLPIVPVRQAFSWASDISGGDDLQFATPRLFGKFHIKELLIYSLDTVGDQFAWSMAIINQPANTFAEHLAGKMIQPSETPVFTRDDQLEYATNERDPQRVPIGLTQGIFFKVISINISGLGGPSANRIAIHLTIDAII